MLCNRLTLKKRFLLKITRLCSPKLMPPTLVVPSNPLAGEPCLSFGFPHHRMPFAVPASMHSIGYEEAEPGYSWNGLTRQKFGKEIAIIQWTLEGEGLLRFEKKTHRVLPGDVFILRVPHDHQYEWPSGAAPWKFLFFTLEGPMTEGPVRHIQETHGPVVSISPQSPFWNVAMNCFRRMPLQPGTELYESSRMAWTLLMSLASSLATPTKTLLGKTLPAVQWIRQDFQRDLSVPELAAACGMSCHHFSRRFHSEQGMPPRLFLERIRMQHAAQLLLGTKVSVQEIAPRCGYSNTSYFIKIFQRTYGCTPITYRRR